jgi:hypothetical protein
LTEQGSRALFLIIAFGGVLVSAPRASYAAVAQLVLPSNDQPQIQGLTWSQDRIEVLPPESPTGLPTVRLNGNFSVHDSALVHDARVVSDPDKDNGKTDFNFPVILTGQKTSVEIIEIDLRGVVVKEKLILKVDDWPALLNSFHAERKRPISVGAALSYINLNQSRIPSFSEEAVTFKLAYQSVFFRPFWSLNASVFFTAVPFHSNLSPYEARFFGSNLRVGYRLPFVHEPWEVQIFGGVYYTTMFVTDNAFGYQNEIGPQLYPTVRRYFKNGDSMSVYFKYSPVEGGQSDKFSSENREVAFGLGWNHRLVNQHFVSVTLDFAQVHLVSEAISSVLQCNSISLGSAYSF